MGTKYGFLISDETKGIVAVSCWHTGAFDVNFKSPYKLKSGNMSPIYVSTEQILGDPVATDVCISLARAAIDDLDYGIVAGGELRGALFGKDLASSVGKPFVVVKKLPKDYGAGTQKPKLIQCMKGDDFKGKIALLCEDLITDGGSKIGFIKGIRDTGGEVNDCLVFVDRQQDGRERLSDVGVNLIALTDLDNILKAGKNMGRLDKKGFNSIEQYREDPKKWNLDRDYEWHE